METIGDNICAACINPTWEVFDCRGDPQKYWLEIQFVDENNTAVTGLNVILEYPPLTYRSDPTPLSHPPAGITDGQGLVRFDNLYPVAVSVKVDAQPLADEMEQRPLAMRRNPHSQPVGKNAFRREMRDKSWRSEVQDKTEAAGHSYHYVTIGELCDRVPQIAGWDEPQPPEFHFPPGRSLKGIEIGLEALEQRHVIEICPFRAWMLALHDTREYDLANGLNLGIMADLVYSAEAQNTAIDDFFRQQCLDLSSIPHFARFPSYFHTLAVDVPFRDRYLAPSYLNSRQGGNPEGDTRLLTVECAAHVLVAWCGTDSLLNVLTNASFGPKLSLPALAAAGNIHGGFLDACELARRKFGHKLDAVNQSLQGGAKKLFICGHSLGGALALLYAAGMKESHPQLYTYGMPRTFTRAAMPHLNSIIHYRHVNDNDTVPQVPQETDMDSLFYQTLGPLGDKLGFSWLAMSISGLYPLLWQRKMETEMGIRLKRDPYWHHGNAVLLFRAQQCVMKLASPYRKSLVDGEVYYRHIVAAKLFLVPSLNDECLKATGEHQAAFIQCLTPASLEKIFPKNTHPTPDGLATNPLSHSMAYRYLPCIHNQVLELAAPNLPMGRKEAREQFENEVKGGDSGNSNQHETQRNRQFLVLQNMLPMALQRTQSEETGRNALLRFAAVAKENAEF